VILDTTTCRPHSTSCRHAVRLPTH